MHRPRQLHRHRAVRSVQDSLARLLRTWCHVVSGERKVMRNAHVLPINRSAQTPRRLCRRSMTSERSPSLCMNAGSVPTGWRPLRISHLPHRGACRALSASRRAVRAPRTLHAMEKKACSLRNTRVCRGKPCETCSTTRYHLGTNSFRGRAHERASMTQ